ncbi:formate transporter FocB [Escherichia coli]
MRNKLSFDLQLSARKAAIAERIASHKIARSKVSVFLMAMSAGVFMAIGFTFYLSVIADAPSSQALTHLVGGLCFTLGFILLAVCGTSLFTSSVMTVMAKSRGVISWRTWLINALLVACGNLAGIACFSLLIWFSGLVMSENAMWGVAVLHCAEGKMHHTFTESVSLGIMCNLMVCLALWMSYCGRSLCDKIVAIILPITLFVASGFEHCIANLFVIPFAIAIRHFAPTSFWQLAHSSADNFPALTVSHFITANLLPVMLGNIIGGAVLVSICYRAIYLRQEP